MADCALCDHPHEPGERCRTATGIAVIGVEHLPVFCDCPGYEPPEDEGEMARAF
ncbi:hypothetical protein [Mycolicibacterium goodii]|uniref:hypothetical protein n=1 Tax=Mycolicibacterium goodii TaxID=134601 RepID=UPI001BDDA402|nr:hypothetical protein [Mycolicibacterium goodii]MBU8833622.1 hypothetical protein [Mycolicibacterium goodii]